MGMWRTTSKEDKTLLYTSIAKAVNKQLRRKLSFAERDMIIKDIFDSNKKYYDIHLLQMAEFVNENHISKR